MIFIDYLQGISEALKTLDELATSSSALIRPPELQVKKQRNDHDETSCDHAGSDTRDVVRSILSAEYSATDDATDTASADESGGAESTLPLAADVVRLPCQDGGDVGVGGGRGEENASVADADAAGEADHGETDEGDDTVGNDPD